MGSSTNHIYVDTANINSSVSQDNTYNSSHDNALSPIDDLYSYSRTMHQHTKKQMEAASRSARRRAEQDARTYPTEESGGSMTSVDSRS